MQQRFKQLQAETPDQLLMSLDLGVGIHSGEVIVGNIGSERVMDYTVIGDPVNVARRLQETAEGGQVLISGETKRQVDNAQVEYLGEKLLHGRDAPVEVFALQAL
jgi:adenylate cyclase